MAETESHSDIFYLEKTLSIPSHISSLAFGHAAHLFAGSIDGSLRVYDLSSYKVLKAIRGLDAEVSSIICVKRPGSELRDAWIAHGQKASSLVSRFQMESSKMIQTLEDALVTIGVGETEADILNELALNANKSHLAFTMDSGFVGVIDLSNNSVTKMDTKHDNVCGNVKFVPDRPRELVSGGYDTALLHFDFVQGKVLSRRQMDPYVAVGGMSLAPPFIMSMAMSNTAVLAAGTADGRVWLGFGGEKGFISGKAPKKKAKKWEGLDEKEALLIKVAEGPIVAMAFSDARTLTISTLMGVITHYRLNYDEAEGSVVLQQLWQKASTGVDKVNALVADDKRIIVGGFKLDGQGIIEIWKQGTSSANNEPQKSS
ncbi:WD40-repeat-containing domain protein [Flammula alnicola]|nr:WD40-repeat-containing domain protein [Flammula alnicola]